LLTFTDALRQRDSEGLGKLRGDYSRAALDPADKSERLAYLGEGSGGGLVGRKVVSNASIRGGINLKRITLAGLMAVLTLSVGACTAEEMAAESESKKNRSSKANKKSDEPDMTSAQKNAVGSAQNYLDLSGFSKRGLIQQLSSSAGDGYARKDAVFAVNHLSPDWNKEAVQSAKNYLDISPMSKTALIEQLSSSAGDGFTRAQAEYAANKVY
jgi:hypothetical protein